MESRLHPMSDYYCLMVENVMQNKAKKKVSILTVHHF